jgi:hypothetical protein
MCIEVSIVAVAPRQGCNVLECFDDPDHNRHIAPLTGRAPRCLPRAIHITLLTEASTD